MSNQAQAGLTMITGGAWSGKTKFAQSIMETAKQLTWVGTASRLDPQLSQHVDQVAALRPPHWQTIEASLNLPTALQNMSVDSTPLIIDSANQWLGNITATDSLKYTPTQLLDHVTSEYHLFLESIARHCAMRPTIVVTAEVGWSITPESPVAAVMRRVICTMNQDLAKQANQVYLVCSGIGQMIKS